MITAGPTFRHTAKSGAGSCRGPAIFSQLWGIFVAPGCRVGRSRDKSAGAGSGGKVARRPLGCERQR
jgi:hypothetical protein